MGNEVPFDYLIIERLPAIFRPNFSDEHNWNSGKDLYCLPSTSGDIGIAEWHTRLSSFLGEKWGHLGINHLIELSISPMEINPEFTLLPWLSGV